VLKRASKLPSLRLLLLVVNLIILAIPISLLYLFRIYENELIRQTESELISQAALVASMYQKQVLVLGGPNYGLTHWNAPFEPDSHLRLVPPKLDRSSSVIHPQPLTPSASSYDPDPIASQAAENLAPIINEATLTTLSTIYLLDFHGLIVSKGPGYGLSLERNEEVAKALEGQYHSLLRARQIESSSSLSSASRDTPFRVFAAMPVFNGQRLAGVVLLSRTPRELMKALYQERFNLALAGALVLTLMVSISLLASLLIISPVKRLAREARQVADDPSITLPDKAPWELVVVREVAELRSSVSFMAERLSRRSDYLKAFASGVSHEFKTPLTSIKGAMELLGEHGRDMDPNVFSKFSDNIRIDLERLERLVGRLLSLAKAEAIKPTGAEKTDAAGLVEALGKRLSANQGEFKVILNSNQPFDIAIDKDVLETVLINLFDNSRESGATEVKVTLQRNLDEACIEVEDNGPGLSAEAQEKIFTPFYTTRKNRGGTGLGLNLARTLLTPYQGKLDFVGPPAVFKITVPTTKG
jgi:signal transduction histidine kinase